MKSMIRWQGLGAFCFVIALGGIFVIFFVDGIIERTIETQGSVLVGAKVELDGADLSFFPAGLALSRLQITNPEKPFRNSLEIERITMSIDSLRLLQRKIIIDEMVVEGIRLDTIRQKSGALPGYVAGKKEIVAGGSKKGIKLPSLQIPDVKEVLAAEQLASIELAREFQEQIKADKLKWQQRLAELPNEAKLNQYKDRLKKIKSSSGLTGILGGATELVAVRKEIQRDLDLLQSARKDFAGISASYKARLAELKNAPSQDIIRLVDKYSFSAKGLSNLTLLLFGSNVGSVVEQALAWYAKAQPLLERVKERKGGGVLVKPTRGTGMLVRFEEVEPLPDFLIREIAASVHIAAGSFNGTIKNVTPDQDILGVPLYFAFTGDSLQGLQTIGFDGILDHVDPTQPHDTLNLDVKGYALDNAELSGGQKQPVTINSGLVDLTVQAVLKRRDIDAHVLVRLKSANISAPAKQGDAISQAIASALSGVTNVSASGKVTGTIDDYDIKISSDLDNILKQAVGNSLKKQAARFKNDLQEGVMAKVKEPLAAASGSFSDFSGISEELATRLQAGNNLL